MAVSVRQLLLIVGLICVCPLSQADELQWSVNIEGSLKQAAASGRPVLMEFTADWCGYCKRMEKTTFTDPGVVAFISQNFIPVRVDADKNKALVADLAIKGLPAILIVSSDLQIIERISGFQTAEALLAKLEPVPGKVQQGSRGTVVAQQAAPQRPTPRTTQRPGELEFEAITHEEARMADRAPVRPVSRAAQTPAEPQRPAASDASEFFDHISSGESVQRSKPPASKERSLKPAFQGQCLVTATDHREIVSGSSKFQTTYRGHLLYFQGSEQKDAFLAEPGRYWPMLDGACAITLLNDDQRVEGELQFAAVFRRKIWLFSSEQAMQDFLEEPAEVVEEVAEIIAAESGR